MHQPNEFIENALSIARFKLSAILVFACCNLPSSVIAVPNGSNCFGLSPTSSWLTETDSLMNLAANNAEVQANLAIVAATSADLQAAQRYFNPNLILSGNLSANTSPNNTYLYQINPEGTPELQAQFLNQGYAQALPTLQLNLPVINLSQRSQIRAQAKKYVASLFQASRTRQERALEIAKIYLDLKRRLYDLAVSRSLISIYNDQIVIAKRLRKAGQASLIDVLNAEQQLLAYRQKREQALADIEGLVANIGTLANRELCRPLPEVQSVMNERVEPPSSAEVQNSTGQALALSPRLNQLTAESQFLEEQAQAIKRGLLPTLTLSLGVTGTYQKGQVSGYAPQPTESNNITDGYALVQVNWNIFDGGVTAANSYSALNKSRSQELARKQAAINLQESIRSIAQQLPLLEQKLNDAKSNLEIQKKVVELVGIGYRAGYKSYLEFEIAASNLYNAATNMASTEFELGSQVLNYESNLLFPSFPKTNLLLSLSGVNKK